MGECHFDLAPLPGGTLKGLGSSHCADMLAFGLKQVARDDPLFSFGAAQLLGAGAAILGARPVRHGAVVAYQAGAPELFSGGTGKSIGLRIKSEVGAGEIAIGLVLPVEQRNVRLDPAPH